jgi:hypothetical protein
MREWAGVVIAAAGAALVPVGWYFSRWLWIAAFVLFMLGLVLLLTDRVIKAEREVENLSEVNPPPIRPAVPVDMHNYSGWRDGGRSLGGGDSSIDAND